jgi:cyanophycin synthetase
MKIENIQTLRGENVYHDAPVLVMTLNLEELAGKETHEVTGFMDRLLRLLPGIKQHYCERGRTGDLNELAPTMIGFRHVTARVALELATLAGVPVHMATVIDTDDPRCCQIVVEFKDEAAMRFLLHTTVELIEALVRGEAPPLKARLAEAGRRLGRRAAEYLSAGAAR